MAQKNHHTKLFLANDANNVPPGLYFSLDIDSLVPENVLGCMIEVLYLLSVHTFFCKS